ncbi:FtsX-like permease family protein [Streptomyces sp. NPDC013181]|uniref:FtsX-like permease family protein n=1 Tax=Streptomyces sp. NPDC013181 TaxID=3364864 RepID=UPI00369ABEA2
MLRTAFSQIRHRTGRSLALVAGVLAATTGFTLLTSTAETSQLRTTGTVNDNFRGAYDILVRPAGSRTAQESGQGLVRPNFLSGQFGGITLAQQARIARMSGVDVSAPVAMVGYVLDNSRVAVDVTAQVDRARTQQLITVKPTWHTDRGLSTLDDDLPNYVYVTKNRVVWPDFHLDPERERADPSWQAPPPSYANGFDVKKALAVCDDPESSPPPLEVLPDGRSVPVCPTDSSIARSASGRGGLYVAHLTEGGTFRLESGTSRRLTVNISWPVSMLLAAVDPAQEAKLVGLDKAVVSGRYLRRKETSVARPSGNGRSSAAVPLLMSSAPQVDEQMSATVSRSPAGPVGLAGRAHKALDTVIAAKKGVRVATVPYTVDAVYGKNRRGADLYRIIQSGAPSYRTGADGSLTPRKVRADIDTLWANDNHTGWPTPWLARDGKQRPLVRVPEYQAPDFRAGEWQGEGLAVGTYDPKRLTEFSALSEVPMETYQPVAATGADTASRRLLGGRALLPNSNPGGYLATPPQLLTTLAALPRVLDPSSEQAAAPISAIRVRVDGVTGTDARSRERVRLVAERISRETGLGVDLTMGSSPAPRTVHLPAGDYGRPALALSEGWSRKGVAARIVEAADRKSLLLFGLVLGVCALFLVNSASAAVRDRRRELAVLACLGWSRSRITALVIGETALLGIVAGGLGALLSLLLAGPSGLGVSPLRAAAAVPIALALSVLAAAVPALRASAGHPATSLRPAVRAARRPRSHRTVTGLARANLVRVPGRTLLGAAALAVGVAAVTSVAAILWSFEDDVVGTVMGDAIALRARGVDIAAAAGTALLGSFAAADVIYLGIRERAAEFAVLRASGWSDGELIRLVLTEGALLGGLGALTGSAAGLGLMARLTGSATPALVTTALLAALAGIVLATAASLVPALMLTRTADAALLQED